MCQKQGHRLTAPQAQQLDRWFNLGLSLNVRQQVDNREQYDGYGAEVLHRFGPIGMLPQSLTKKRFDVSLSEHSI
jgi:hypothetical protein